MKKQFFFWLTILAILPFISFSQTTETTFGIKWKGFVKTDYMFDTRQVTASREGHFSIIPAAESLDADGNDLNAHANFNILSIQSRLTGAITGPDFFKMKTSGLLEADFFGNSGTGLDDVNGFRLRHAFVKLSNDKFDILMGQFWHPMFITESFPGVYSFNTGVPFQAFSRNPQLRFSTKGKARLVLTAFTERDFATRGASVSRSAVPQVNAQFQYGSTEKVLAGLGVNYKTANPGLGLDNVTSTAFIGFARLALGKAVWKLQGIYGQNMSDVLMIGAFATNAKGDFVSNNTLSVWTEIQGDISDKGEWGLFAGYTENSGFGEAVTFSAANGFLSNVASMYRVAPRIGFKSGSLTIGTELEYTSAQYGVLDITTGSIDIEAIDPVSNVRLLLTAIYKF